VAASTGAINADLQNYKTTVQLSTAGIAAALANVVTSTGAIQASLNNVIASTGVIQTSLNNVIASTGAFQTSLNNVVISTGVIAADLAAEVAARALADSAIGLATATLRTDLNAISTAGFTAVGLATATLRTDLNAVAASTAPLANAANWNTAYGWGDHAEAGYAALSATQPFTGQNTFSNPGNVFYGDGSHLTGVSTGTVVEVYANNGTLGIGTAFYSFTTRVDITIHRLTATIYESGSAGSSIFRCGSAVDFVDVAVSGTDIIGQRVTVLTTKNIAKNTEVLCKIQESTQEDTPTVALSLQYSPS